MPVRGFLPALHSVKGDLGRGEIVLISIDTPTGSFFDWMAGRGRRWPSVCSGGHVLGSVFNQLVRSRAQLLVAE